MSALARRPPPFRDPDLPEKARPPEAKPWWACPGCSHRVLAHVPYCPRCGEPNQVSGPRQHSEPVNQHNL